MSASNLPPDGAAMPADIWSDFVHWEDAESDVLAIRPRDAALTTATADQVLLGVRHLNGYGTVRLPLPHQVAYGVRYGPQDMLVGVMARDGEPSRRDQYRVLQIKRMPGTLRRVLLLEKIEAPT